MTRVYGYATGVFSSRKLERATYDLVAFGFIAANDHPDHDTIATFRRRFLKEIEGLFVQVLALAREIGMLKLGTGGARRHEDPRQCQPGQDPSKCSRRILLLSHEWRVVPWPELWINHSAWPLIIGSQVRALVPPPPSPCKPHVSDTTPNRAFLQLRCLLWQTPT